MRKVVIMGAGPAGLMAAEVLAGSGVAVDVYDAMPSVGRKFLIAGKGGLNLTHAEPFAAFVARYGERREWLAPWLVEFGPQALRQWAHGLGVETFVGSSGRVFPAAMKAAPLLRAWLARLRAGGVRFHMRHRWLGWDERGSLRLATADGEKRLVLGEGKTAADPAAVILALGGGSRARTGSDGAWLPWLQARGVAVTSLKPANCGFDVPWSEFFRERFAGQPVKTVIAGFAGQRRPGEFVVTQTGIEGSLVYALSAGLRDAIETHGEAILTLDLLPDRHCDWLAMQIGHPRGARSMASHLQGRVGIAGVKAGLLRECVAPEDFAEPSRLATQIKSLPLRLTAPRPLDEAISSAGGVMPEAVDERLMLKSLPGIFCAGEMLDWEAPTGGYLLTACFASGAAAARGVMAWLA